MNVVLIVIIYYIFIFTLIFSVHLLFCHVMLPFTYFNIIHNILKNGNAILVKKYYKWQNKMTNIIIYNDNILYLVQKIFISLKIVKELIKG